MENRDMIRMVNHGDKPVEVQMICDGSLSTIRYRLEPGGRCTAGLTDVEQIVFVNTEDGEVQVTYRAIGDRATALTIPGVDPEEEQYAAVK